MSGISDAYKRLEITRGIKAGKAGIDRAFEDEQTLGVIRGVAVMTKGFVKDVRGWEIDDTTLSEIVQAGNKHINLGVKARFGHPNMSSSALGTFLGRVKNFYLDGDIARADLFLSRTAYQTPEGNLAAYVLDLAEKDPAAFGTSVVLGQYKVEQKLGPDGKPLKDEAGNTLPPVLRVTSVLAVDTVDDPAANNGMFGRFFNSSVELSAKASEYLDKLLNNPESLDFVLAFLERYRANREDIDGENHQPKEKDMELKDLTQEQLSKERPELVAALQNEAVKSERSRCLGIVKSAHGEFKGLGMEGIVEDAVENGKAVDSSLAAMRGKRLDDIKKESNKAPGPDGEEPAAGKLSHLDRAKKYQTEHKCSITEALKATAEPRK